MEVGSILEFLENRSILVTGATGFLAKIFVEKILRVQPNVKKLYLLMRAPDSNSAMHRFDTEIISKDLFRVLKEKHGGNLNSLISQKIRVVAGDISLEDLGVKDSSLMEELIKEVDVVVNLAANTNFDERYDISIGINTMGAKHVLNFSKKCDNLKVLLHMSTAYVSGEKEGLILERPYKMGEALNGASRLNIEAEKKLIDDTLKSFEAQNCSDDFIKSEMKDLGIQRTIDSLIVGYGKGKLTCFLGNPKTIIDAIPTDMVINAMIVAMTVHSNHHGETIYHVGTSVLNPLEAAVFQNYGQRYFMKHPWINKKGKSIIVGNVKLLTSMESFQRYLNIHYLLPLKGLEIMNIACCQYFQAMYLDMCKKIKFVVHLVELYRPYLFFEGCFDDMNAVKLRRAIVSEAEENDMEINTFYFNPKVINWEDYFMNVHVPGIVKYVFK